MNFVPHHTKDIIVAHDVQSLFYITLRHGTSRLYSVNSHNCTNMVAVSWSQCGSTLAVLHNETSSFITLFNVSDFSFIETITLFPCLVLCSVSFFLHSSSAFIVLSSSDLYIFSLSGILLSKFPCTFSCLPSNSFFFSNYFISPLLDSHISNFSRQIFPTEKLLLSKLNKLSTSITSTSEILMTNISKFLELPFNSEIVSNLFNVFSRLDFSAFSDLNSSVLLIIKKCSEILTNFVDEILIPEIRSIKFDLLKQCGTIPELYVKLLQIFDENLEIYHNFLKHSYAYSENLESLIKFLKFLIPPPESSDFFVLNFQGDPNSLSIGASLLSNLPLALKDFRLSNLSKMIESWKVNACRVLSDYGSSKLVALSCEFLRNDCIVCIRDDIIILLKVDLGEILMYNFTEEITLINQISLKVDNPVALSFFDSNYQLFEVIYNDHLLLFQVDTLSFVSRFDFPNNFQFCASTMRGTVLLSNGSEYLVSEISTGEMEDD
ncbi:hypothetical protein RCL1_002234 [Eukaryota sp. TZLM3-RCL]